MPVQRVLPFSMWLVAGDLAAARPDDVAALRAAIDAYVRSGDYSDSQNMTIHKEAFPAQHNGTWVPWLPDPLAAAAPGTDSRACAGELLYNGVCLPARWPPAELPACMASPPPYLEAPPAVINISVGRPRNSTPRLCCCVLQLARS
jgi:hypothetical protein